MKDEKSDLFLSEEQNLGVPSSKSQTTPELKAAHTQLPWIVQKLNHVENDPWFQIGWIEGGHALGPICEMVGGAVKPAPSFKAVAEFKYLVASESEIRANAELIVRAVNAHDALVEALSCALDDFRSLSKEPSAKAARMRAQTAYQGVRAALALANGHDSVEVVDKNSDQDQKCG